MAMANEQEFDFSISEIQFNSTQTDSFFQNLSSNNNSEDSCTSLNYNDKKKRNVVLAEVSHASTAYSSSVISRKTASFPVLKL